MITAKKVADIWIETLRTTPWPTRSLIELIEGPRRTYRERLDEQPRNFWGELIPRIVIVRRNLVLLGKPHRPPKLPTSSA